MLVPHNTNVPNYQNLSQPKISPSISHDINEEEEVLEIEEEEEEEVATLVSMSLLSFLLLW